jgi:glycosyltransferase involved in cell wall biosynthesis
VALPRNGVISDKQNQRAMNQSCSLSKPSVSVVIPVYNGERFLGAAITSILQQTILPRELIVIDDGSTDRTPQIASGFGTNIRYYRQDRRGPPAARNYGIEKAKSEWVSLLDADDVWPENSLELQLAPVENDDSLQVVVGHALLWSGPDEESARLPYELPKEPRLIMNLGSALIRKSLFKRLGPLNTQMFYCDDWDWFMRARELGIRMHVHAGLVLYYRRHEGNLTNNRQMDNHFIMRMLKQSLDRRRAAGSGSARSLPHLQKQFLDNE